MVSRFRRIIFRRQFSNVKVYGVGYRRIFWSLISISFRDLFCFVLWKSRAKLCRITPGEWKGSRKSLQELDFVYIMFWIIRIGCNTIVYWLTNRCFNPATQDRFAGGETLWFDFQCEYSKPSVKKTKGRDTEWLMLFSWFGVLWLLVACGRRSYLGPVEISSVVYLIRFKDWGCRVSCLYCFR